MCAARGLAAGRRLHAWLALRCPHLRAPCLLPPVACLQNFAGSLSRATLWEVFSHTLSQPTGLISDGSRPRALGGAFIKNAKKRIQEEKLRCAVQRLQRWRLLRAECGCMVRGIAALAGLLQLNLCMPAHRRRAAGARWRPRGWAMW